MSLVPAAGWALSGYNTAKRLRTGYNLGAAYRRYAPYVRYYGPGTLKAVKKMGRFMKRRYKKRYGGRKARMRRRIGEPVGKSTSKRFTTIDLDAAGRDSRRLYIREMTQIPQDLTGNNIDERQRYMINLRGFKICCELRNTGGVPLLFNMAVVSPKGQKSDLEQNPILSVGTAVEPDFFRGNGNTRAVAFDGGALNSNDFHCRPINADQFTILMHKRMIIGQNSNNGTWGEQQRNSYRFVMKYIPIKRQIRYDTNGADSCQSGKIFLIYWYDQMQSVTGAASVNVLNMSERYITYFKEPKN